jgi:ATP-dependent Clp protease adaptor protein ClpS
MATKEKKKEKFDDLTDDKKDHVRNLILHNDEVNTFDFVIDTLIEVCNHDILQAEQCAMITHYKGKCDVKNGSLEVLKPMKDQLISKGLNATID